jgi:hypothetical protein
VSSADENYQVPFHPASPAARSWKFGVKNTNPAISRLTIASLCAPVSQ